MKDSDRPGDNLEFTSHFPPRHPPHGIRIAHNHVHGTIITLSHNQRNSNGGKLSSRLTPLFSDSFACFWLFRILIQQGGP